MATVEDIFQQLGINAMDQTFIVMLSISLVEAAQSVSGYKGWAHEACDGVFLNNAMQKHVVEENGEFTVLLQVPGHIDINLGSYADNSIANAVADLGWVVITLMRDPKHMFHPNELNCYATPLIREGAIVLDAVNSWETAMWAVMAAGKVACAANFAQCTAAPKESRAGKQQRLRKAGRRDIRDADQDDVEELALGLSAVKLQEERPARLTKGMAEVAGVVDPFKPFNDAKFTMIGTPHVSRMPHGCVHLADLQPQRQPGGFPYMTPPAEKAAKQAFMANLVPSAGAVAAAGLAAGEAVTPEPGGSRVFSPLNTHERIFTPSAISLEEIMAEIPGPSPALLSGSRLARLISEECAQLGSVPPFPQLDSPDQELRMTVGTPVAPARPATVTLGTTPGPVPAAEKSFITPEADTPDKAWQVGALGSVWHSRFIPPVPPAQIYAMRVTWRPWQ